MNHSQRFRCSRFESTQESWSSIFFQMRRLEVKYFPFRIVYPYSNIVTKWRIRWVGALITMIWGGEEEIVKSQRRSGKCFGQPEGRECENRASSRPALWRRYAARQETTPPALYRVSVLYSFVSCVRAPRPSTRSFQPQPRCRRHPDYIVVYRAAE